MGLTAVLIPVTACSDRSVALLVGLLAERLVASLAASTACSESILILTGITAAIGAINQSVSSCTLFLTRGIRHDSIRHEARRCSQTGSRDAGSDAYPGRA